MTKMDDGGEAFPITHEQYDIDSQRWRVVSTGGMPLRDYFAAKAMAGSLAGEPGPHLVPHTLARDSYAMADAMLKARQS